MLACVILATLLHGGQYLPPLPEPGADADLPVPQPGTGPTFEFQPARWEWWFDFNQEQVLQLRQRMRSRPSAGNQLAFEPVTDADRKTRVLPELVNALRNPARNVRGAACMALGHLALPDVVPYLDVMVEDPDLFVRTHALLALGVSDQPGAVETLGRVLRDRASGAELRTFAAASLGLIGNEEAVDLLAAFLTPKALAEEKNMLRAGLVYAAGLSGSPRLTTALGDLEGGWLFDNDAQLRALAAISHGKIGDDASIDHLLKALGDRDNQVRRSVATGLEGVAARLDADAVGAVIAHYRGESDVPARFNLLRALGRTGDDKARKFLVDEFRRSTNLLRPHAALSLALDGDPSHAGPLLVQLPDQHELSGRSALVLSLGLLGDPEAIDPVREALDRAREPALMGYGCLALGLLAPDDDDFVPRVEGILAKATDIEVIRLGTIALAVAGEREALMRQVPLATEAATTLQRAARLAALGWVGDRRLIDPLIEVIRDETQTSYVTTFAVQALGEISDPRDTSPLGALSAAVELNHDIGFLFELYRAQ